jgi:signal peptidase I
MRTGSIGRRGLVFWFAVAAFAVALARRLERVEVTGDSMLPTLRQGDRVLMWRTRRVRPGMLVVLPDPRVGGRPLVKRVAAGHGATLFAGGKQLRAGPDEVLLLGDDPEHSTDSRTFGAVRVAALDGRVVYRYAPGARAGRVR